MGIYASEKGIITMNILKNEIINNVMKNVPFYRKKNNLTQKQLADKIGVKPTTVSTWERGGNLPDIETMINMCRLFDISLNDILGIDNMPDDCEFKTKEEMDIIREYRNADSCHKQMVLCALGLEKKYTETDKKRA